MQAQPDALRADAEAVVRAALDASMPDAVVRGALKGRTFPGGRLLLLAVGKAAWQMARTAADMLDGRIGQGIVITKYGHSRGALKNIRVFEAGHPVPDQNGVAATAEALRMTEGLTAEDTVLFLVSGGGSALFEQPLVPLETLAGVTRQLLSSGADIRQVNCIRKRLSAVKGGRFAAHCAPANVLTVALSDVLGDDPAAIASGPAVPDAATSADALRIAGRYGLQLDGETRKLLSRETPKVLANAEVVVAGGVGKLCQAAVKACEAIGYESTLLTDSLSCAAREAGRWLGTVARTHRDTDRPLAFVAGGETVVNVRGDGLGGRNQELALSAAPALDGLAGVGLIAIGSDGTDGPTDAAGGYVDGHTAGLLQSKGIAIGQMLDRNDSYHALEACGGLVITGPTGTNVNDLAVLLIRR